MNKKLSKKPSNEGSSGISLPIISQKEESKQRNKQRNIPVAFELQFY